MLTAPLRERFGIVHHFDYYAPEQLERILRRSAAVLGVEIDVEGARTIAARSRGTPRVANRLLRRVRDYAEVRAEGRIDAEVAREALAREGVDELGLDRLDRGFLRTILEQYGGGPVGMSAIAATLTEDAETLEDVVEPYLLKQGFVIRTASGRRATDAARKHLRVRCRVDPRAAAVTLRRSHFLGLVAATCALPLRANAQDDVDPASNSARPALRVLLGSGDAQPAPGGGFVFAGRSYRGTFERLPSGEIVNLVDVEQYLYSVVPREMPPSWAAAALQAQALCARTYVLQRSDPRRAYDLVPSEADQVYDRHFRAKRRPAGPQLTRPPARSSNTTMRTRKSRTRRAAAATPNRRPRRGPAAAVLPYLGGVPCTYCSSAPYYRWQTTITLDDVTRVCGRRLDATGALQNLRVSSVNASGRARAFDLVCERGTVTIKGATFRLLVGSHALRSLLVSNVRLAPSPPSLWFEGAGSGHGVGLCQWGARGLATLGHSAADIVAWYFPGTVIGNA